MFIFLRITKISHKFVILNYLFVIELREINTFIRIGLLDLKVFAESERLQAKREIERAGTLYVLKHLLNFRSFDLKYTEENKPYLKGREEHISISHSHDKLAIIINSKENTGIDIELIREKVLNIQQKFLSPEELNFANNNIEKLVTMWAAKETLYKIFGLKEVEFIANLHLEDFEGSDIIGTIETTGMVKTFLLKQETIENYKLVYALHELS